MLELLSAWLRFLETRGLVGAEQCEQALNGCRELAESLFKFVSAQAPDPALAEGLRQSGLISE